MNNQQRLNNFNAALNLKWRQNMSNYIARIGWMIFDGLKQSVIPNLTKKNQEFCIYTS